MKIIQMPAAIIKLYGDSYMSMDINKKSKLIVFYSPQGGAGKSTLAVNTAIFSAIHGSKTLLVDMSIYGNVISSLKIQQRGGFGLTSVITLLDLDKGSTSSYDFNEAVKNSIRENVPVENLDVIISANPIKMEAMNVNYTKRVMESIRNLGYNNIIIDTSSELNEKNFTLLQMADYVVIPVIQDISCGWKMVLFKEISERYITDSSKTGLVINKCNKYSGFNNIEFENEIGYKIIGEVPLFLKHYQNYINEGLTINSMKNKKAYKSFSNIAQHILENVK